MADDDLATPAAADPDIQGAPAPTDAGPQIVPDAVPVANEPDIARSADQAAAARQTRAYRGGRPLPAQPAPIAAPEPEGDENPYTRFGTSEDDGIGLYERFRLNALNSYYRGTLAGSGRMMALAHLVRNPDADDLSPEEKKAHDDQRVQYQEIIADLARYDLIAGWSGGSEAASAFGGTVAGSLLSPESFVGAAAKGASVIARTGRAALQQAGIMAAVDPLVQYQSIAGGTEKDFSPTRWMMSAGVGAIIGGGLHFGGELVGNLALKRTFADLAGEDASFYKPGQEAQPEGAANAGRTGEPAREPGGASESTPATEGVAAPEAAGAATPEGGGAAQPREAGAAGEIVGVPHRVTTPGGMSVDVQPTVMEARDLITSSDAGYDAALQPRDRDRAASQQQIREIAGSLDPERLGYSPEADRGAPIIGDDRMVESGNGRVAAIRQVYAEGGEAAQRYRDWLAAQGVDLSKYEQPVLVRQRMTPLSPEERAGFALGANQAATLSFSASERALADARMLGPDALDLIRNPGDLGAAANQDFIRSFVRKLPQAEQGAMLNAQGSLSSEGMMRVRNAVLASAYGDAPVLARIAEATDDEIKSISSALVTASPEWAKLRSDVRAGTVRPDVDLTPELVEAVQRTADIRNKGMKLDAYLAQQDAFERMSDPVEAFMRMFYDPKGKRAAGAPRIADALTFYAQEARKVSAEGGLDLGLAPVTAGDIQRTAMQRSFPHGNEATLFARSSARDGAGGTAGGGEVSGRGAGEGGAGAAGAGGGGAGPGRGAADELAMRTAKRVQQEGASLFDQREAEGQTRMPGVGGGTLKEKLDQAAARPLSGGQAGPKEGGLFDTGARDQGDLFMTVARRGGDGEMRLVSVPENEVRPTDRVQAAPEGEQAAIAQRQGGGRIPMEQKRPAEGIESPQVPQTSRSQTTVDINGQRTRIQDGVVSADAAEAAGPKESAIRSLQQQATDFADAIGLPLRQGRMAGHGKDTLGIFKSKSGVVRVREVPDFEVVAHEGGHYIEAKMGQDLTDLIEQFGPTELAKMVSNPAAYDPAVHAKEGFAEYIRRYIGNPNFAANQAPGFTTAFRDFMNERAPQMLHAIDDASAAYRAYLEAPSVDAVGAVIRSQDEGAHGWRSYLPRKIRDEGFPVIIKTMMQDSYSNILDRNHPIARAVRELGRAIRDQKGGELVDLKAADNPDTLMRLFARSQQGAVRDMMDGVRGYRDVVPQGPSLSQALAKATGSPTVFGRWNQPLVDSFSTYLIARRAIVLWDRFGRGDLPNPPTAFSKGDATVALQDLERANPSFREAGDMVHGWTRQLLKKQFDGGLIGADLYNRLTQEEFYVPFMRDLSDKPLAGGGGPGGGSGAPGERVADTVKAIKGSARDIKNPIESLMMQAFLVNRAVKHNDIIKSFVNLAQQAGIEGGRFVEKIPAQEMRKYTFDLKEAIERAARDKGMNGDDTEVLTSALSDVFGEDPLVGSFFRAEPAGARGEPIVFYKNGGEMQAARFMSGEEGHALYETLTALPSGISDVAMQLFSAGSTLLRGTITTNPVFALTNYIRDQVAVGILRKDYIPFVSGTKGIVSEVTEGESAKLYGYAGGVSAGASVAPLEQAAQAEINALAKQGYLVNRLSSLHGLLELSAITEAGTRNSVFDTVYNAKRAQGLSDYEAMIEAAFQAQDILDFSRWGSKTLAIRRLTPFVNAHMQGLDKAARTTILPLIRQARGDQVFTSDIEAVGNIGRNAARVANNAVFALTKLFAVGGSLGAAWAALHHNDEIYQDARPELKGTHFVTSIGNKIFVIPKPFELSLGFTAGEYAYQALMKNDPRSAAAFVEAAYEVLKPPLPVFDNPLIKTSMELYLGKSGFFGRDIVPDALQRLQPSEQYTDRTSSVAKSIGQTIGVSPIKVDYAIGAYFGLWGRDIMSLSSGVDERTPAQNWEDRALVRRFIKDPTRSSETVGQFWKFMGQTTGQFNQAVATYDFFNKSFRDQEAQDFLAKLPAPERAFTILRSAAREDGKPAFGPDEKRLFPLQRAYDAVAILNGMRRELSDNSFRAIETGTPQQFSPRERRDLIDDLRELAQMEMRNSFVVMKTKGYANRPLMDVQAIYDKVRAIAPPVAEELATRYATGRIYKTEAVAASYDKMQAELIRNGSQAELMDLSADAKAMGYEFGGERVRKPQKRRVMVPAAAIAPVRPASAVAEPPAGR